MARRKTAARPHFNNPHTQKMFTLFQSFGYCRDAGEIFRECMELWATELLLLTGAADEAAGKHFGALMEKLADKERETYEQLSEQLLLALEREAANGGPRDVLGEIYENLGITNDHAGQFFTPSHLCEMMAELTIGPAEEAVEKTGYLSVSDPCVGSGRLLYAAAKAAARKNINYQRQVYMEAVDVDIRCVWMSYIQLSLYGIPARVFHGDALSRATHSVWRTPAYILDGWESRIYPENRCEQEEPAC